MEYLAEQGLRGGQLKQSRTPKHQQASGGPAHVERGPHLPLLARGYQGLKSRMTLLAAQDTGTITSRPASTTPGHAS